MLVACDIYRPAAIKQLQIVGEKLDWRTDIIPLTYLSIAFCLVMTVWSGINYIVSYWKYLDPEK